TPLLACFLRALGTIVHGGQDKRRGSGEGGPREGRRSLGGDRGRLRRCGPYGKDRRIRGRIPSVSHPARRCRSSVVEHSLGKGEVVSSILTGSTRYSEISAFSISQLRLATSSRNEA